ncbi:type II toxin-antitoxin system VapC family toxin [Dyadobacter sp. CY347]|uniref:type II toxin-antitoxin system VapC family toxin n=1 Tax=Dyadobacter sp. CY347 TaxID=2909336 RepID=UPI001F3BA8AD|nr:type II toxin-antitoxin system VapC family toxin [Dyadobacter sp. CY347]MCF2490029.1 type II toxin-antitoxin system VapC family toxin [Dyadobacter sp. CY347]
MAEKIVMVDTSILIDFYRKTDKSNSIWIKLVREGYAFTISAITKYEIYSGANASQTAFWDNVFRQIEIISLDEDCIDTAVHINIELKKKSKQIALADLLIAASAVANEMPLATLNRKHFERIDPLTLIAV